MITASIYRTDPDQVKRDGAPAWQNMNFTASHTSVESIRDYCHTLAARAGIKNPKIIIEESANGTSPVVL